MPTLLILMHPMHFPSDWVYGIPYKTSPQSQLTYSLKRHVNLQTNSYLLVSCQGFLLSCDLSTETKHFSAMLVLIKFMHLVIPAIA